METGQCYHENENGYIVQTVYDSFVNLKKHANTS